MNSSSARIADYDTRAPALSALKRLRSETRPEHDSIERVPLLASVFSEQHTLDDYRELLVRKFRYYSALEARVMPLLPPRFRLLTRPKAPLLADDLRALGVNPSRVGQLDASVAMPALRDAHAALGCLYVLEGSTLGGKVIRKHLLRSLGPDAEGALNFFGCYGAECGANWQRFRDALEDALDPNAGAVETALTSAKATFASLEQALQASGPGALGTNPTRN